MRGCVEVLEVLAARELRLVWVLCSLVFVVVIFGEQISVPGKLGTTSAKKSLSKHDEARARGGFGQHLLIIDSFRLQLIDRVRLIIKRQMESNNFIDFQASAKYFFDTAGQCFDHCVKTFD